MFWNEDNALYKLLQACMINLAKYNSSTYKQILQIAADLFFVFLNPWVFLEIAFNLFAFLDARLIQFVDSYDPPLKGLHEDLNFVSPRIGEVIFSFLAYISYCEV